MSKIPIARGQATIYIQRDGYTLTQSLNEYVFPADATGKILSAITLTSKVRVTCGDEELTAFTIGSIAKPAGFSVISVDNGTKSISYAVAAGVTTLADHGRVDIPITIAGVVYHLSFVWSKARQGLSGADGVDANMLDWVEEWNTGKTLINNSTVITPKIFTGVRNTDGTLTGTAVGRFALSTKNSSGSITTETVDGIYGFRNGIKTFFVDNGGNAQLGYGSQFVKYNAATGKIEFGSEVSLNWTAAISQAKTETVAAAATDATTKSEAAMELARAMAFGKMLYRDPTFRTGTNGVKVYNNSGNGMVVITRRSGTTPNDSGYYLEIQNTGTASPGCGGFSFGTSAGYLKTFIARIIAKIPVGYKIIWASNNIGTGGSNKWLTPAAGTGDWREYIHKVTCGTENFSTTNYYYLSGAVGTADTPLLWQVAYATVFDITASEGYTTTIDANGIYTGTLTAAQVNAVGIDAGSIKTGTIAASRIDVAALKASLITAGNIEALTLSVTKGKIGGWTIGASTLTATHISIDSGNKRIAVYGADSGATSGQRVQLYYNSDTDFGLYATNSAGACVARLGSSNQIAGWVIGTAAITKGNVSLGSDGSIVNSTKWRLNNDGSGQIASGNIAWDAAGNVTFGTSVSLQWKNDIEAAKTTNFGYRYYYKLIINGEENVYYPVVFKGGDQNFKRDILVRRTYYEQAPDTWNTSTHKGGLILLIKANFGGWGGIAYSWDIYELSETYCRMFAGAVHCGNCCMFAVFLRGGGETGAVYHIYSDQPIESAFMSPSPIPAAPQIAYESEQIFQSGSTKAYAPAPRTLTSGVEEEIRRHRFIGLAQSTDSTLAAHPLTYIGSTGIYTGTLTAAQVNAVSIDASSIKAGTLSADRIAAGSIAASKLDAASIKSNIINTDYINGLSCTFTKGLVGGWNIDNNNIHSVFINECGGITEISLRSEMEYRDVNWFTGRYPAAGLCILWTNLSSSGHLSLGEIANIDGTKKSGYMGLQMMD